MSNARHASLAGQLIAACGGVPEILAAKACRLEASQLYAFTAPRAGRYMPADVMEALEGYCGQPIYSQALVDHRPSAVEAKALLHESMETAEGAVALMAFVRKATEDNELDAAERRAVNTLLDQLEAQIRETRAAAERGAP